MDDQVGVSSPRDAEKGKLAFPAAWPNPPSVTTSFKLPLHLPTPEPSTEISELMAYFPGFA